MLCCFFALSAPNRPPSALLLPSPTTTPAKPGFLLPALRRTLSSPQARPVAERLQLTISSLLLHFIPTEVGLLSFLQIKAAEEFNLSPLQESLLTSIVFAGELLGALCFGPLADRVGRWRATFLSAILITVAGLLSAFSTTFAMLVVMRAVVGVGIGGLAVPFDILAEFMPTHIRGKALMGIEYFWWVAAQRTEAGEKERGSGKRRG